MEIIKIIGVPLAAILMAAGLVVFGAIVRAIYKRNLGKNNSDNDDKSVQLAFKIYKRIWVAFASFIGIAFIYIVTRTVWGLVATGRTPW